MSEENEKNEEFEDFEDENKLEGKEEFLEGEKENEEIGVNEYKIIIKIQGESEIARGVLKRTKNPLTAEAINDKLPIKNRARIYKEKEIYVQSIGINKGREKSTMEVSKGDIAYWPLGDGLCIFLEQIEPYSEVNIVGQIVENLDFLKTKVKSGTPLIIEREE